MLRHFGTKRTFTHNFRLAVLLCLTAGFVNAAGFLGFSTLTTNVTGHAALFAESVEQQNWANASTVAIWMLLFLAGAFCSSFIITKIGEQERYSFAVPIFLELCILLFCAFYRNYPKLLLNKEIFAGSLLFAMGLQNALVSVISGSVVRTTHLTGAFTDLGIELGQLCFGNQDSKKGLDSSIKIHLSIIVFFMVGALAGAFLFRHFLFLSFLVPCLILCFTFLYDILRLRIKRYYVNITHK